MKICKIADCGQKHHSRGFCTKHYQRLLKWGSPHKTEKPRFASFEESFKANTEWRGDCLIWTGAISGDYGEINVKGKSIKAHRYAWEREHGSIPVGMLVDHKDHCNTLCVNVNHLRLATPAQNTQNKSGLRSDNISGFRNICWSKSMSMWRVKVGDEILGYFNDIEDAVPVRDKARARMFGEFAGKG